MIEQLLQLKNDYRDCKDPSFHTGNLGAAFAFISLGSTLYNEEVYDFGLLLLSKILDNKSDLNRSELIFLGCITSFLEGNKYLELNDDFYDPIDEFSINYIQRLLITNTDYNIFLSLYYFSKRIDKSSVYQQMHPEILQNIVLVLCELIVKIDKISRNNPSKDYIRFLYCSHMVTVFFKQRGLFSKLSKRLGSSIELAVKHLIKEIPGQPKLIYTPQLRELYTALKISVNAETSDFQNDESISDTLQNLFLMTADDISYSKQYDRIYRALNYKNFGLFNSRLGPLLLNGLSHSKNANELAFFMQVYKNKKYDLSIRTTSRILF